MAEVPGTLEGFYCLHDFRRIDWSRLRLKPASCQGRTETLARAVQFLSDCAAPPDGASAAFRILGHKSDLLILHLRPTLDALHELETAFDRLAFSDFAPRTYSFLSVTELSLYEASARGGSEDPEALRQEPFVRRRLFPPIPDKRYICFYPMNKRRGESVNWFVLPMEERRRMMREHGATGKRFHGKVQQMITGAMGLDDWDWGVTLFADDPLDFKKLIYEMRFDEVSALYAEFGPFQVGIRLQTRDLGEMLNVESDRGLQS